MSFVINRKCDSSQINEKNIAGFLKNDNFCFSVIKISETIKPLKINQPNVSIRNLENL